MDEVAGIVEDDTAGIVELGDLAVAVEEGDAESISSACTAWLIADWTRPLPVR